MGSADGGGLFDLTGRVAVVTGAAHGIGKAIALALARHGADLVVCDLDTTALAGTTAEAETLGRRAISTRADIGNPDDITQLFAVVDDAFGRVDILINNVGMGARYRPEDLPLADFERVIQTGVTGSLLCAQEAGRRMIAAGRGGSIVNISSIAGASALGRGNFVYSVAKGGINQFTRELAVEWSPHKIRVNAIQPAQIMTPAVERMFNDPRL